MIKPVKQTKHNLYVCDMFERAKPCDTIYGFYKNPSSKKISIFTILDNERRGMFDHSEARICGNSELFTFMYTFVSEKTGKKYLRRICKTSEEYIEVVQE